MKIAFKSPVTIFSQIEPGTVFLISDPRQGSLRDDTPYMKLAKRLAETTLSNIHKYNSVRLPDGALFDCDPTSAIIVPDALLTMDYIV